MPKLNKPDLTDFGLTQEEYVRLKKLFPRIQFLVIVMLPFIIWTLVFVLSLQIAQGSLGALMGIAGGALATYVTSKGFKVILFNLPSYRKIRAYEYALVQYTRSQFPTAASGGNRRKNTR